MFWRSVMMRLIPKGGLLLLCTAVMAQTSAPQTPAPAPRRPSTQVRLETAAQRRPAPQVVTIVHRLNGWKMFRLLARSEQQAQAIAGLDSTFNLLDDVHTNVSAGVAMDDGETIAAWLPDAEVETPSQDLRTNFDTPDLSVIGPDGKQLGAKFV